MHRILRGAGIFGDCPCAAGGAVGLMARGESGGWQICALLHFSPCSVTHALNLLHVVLSVTSSGSCLNWFQTVTNGGDPDHAIRLVGWLKHVDTFFL